MEEQSDSHTREPGVCVPPEQRNNEELELFYQSQKLVPADEWATFKASLQRQLPVVVRINGSHSKWTERAQTFEDSPLWSSLEWYPGVDGDEHPRVWQCDGPTYNAVENDSMRLWCGQNNQACTLRHQEAVSLLPPLALDLGKDVETVLDLCAAPGSKTMEIIELLHSAGARATIIANDSDAKRAYGKLSTNIAKTQATNVAVTNWNAARYPIMVQEDEQPVLFDRILADVPCSGDGTLRKNPEIWSTWTARYALKLHKLQRKVLLRGVHFLAEGGILVYSTCSMNPLENEAVVLSVLDNYGDGIYLESIDFGPDFKTSPGMKDWVVPGRYDEAPRFFSEWQEVPTGSRSPKGPLQQTMFVNKASPNHAQLGKCCRVLPHLNNTGAFFLARFRKRKHRDMDSTLHPKMVVPKGGFPWHGRNPKNRFEIMANDNPEWQHVVRFYGLREECLEDKTVVVEYNVAGNCKRMFVADTKLVKLMQLRFTGKPRSVSQGGPCLAVLGAPLFKRMDDGFLSKLDCRWRPANEAARLLSTLMTKRKLRLSRSLFETKLLRGKHIPLQELLHLEADDLQGFESCEDCLGHTLVGVIEAGFEDVWVPCVLTGKSLEFNGRRRDFGNPFSLRFES